MIPEIKEPPSVATSLMDGTLFGHEELHTKPGTVMYYFTSNSYNLSGIYGIEDVAEEVEVTTDSDEESQHSPTIPEDFASSLPYESDNPTGDNSSLTYKSSSKEETPIQPLDLMMTDSPIPSQHEFDSCDNINHQKRKMATDMKSNSSTSYIRLSGDLSIFNCEEPYIVADKRVLSLHPEKCTFEIIDMDIAAEEEVITEQEVITEPGEECRSPLDFLGPVPFESIPTSESNMISERHSANGININTEDLLKTSQLGLDIESTIIPLNSRLWSSDLLMPVVKRGPGFDLIDFINNDFLNDDDILPNCSTSSPVLKTHNDMNSSEMNFQAYKQPVDKENYAIQFSSNLIPYMTRRKYVRRKPYLMKRAHDLPLNKRNRNLSSSSQDYYSSESDGLSIYDDSLPFSEKRIRNNISSKKAREKRKRELAMQVVEMQELLVKNSRLKKEKTRLKRVIKYITSQLYKKG